MVQKISVKTVDALDVGQFVLFASHVAAAGGVETATYKDFLDP